MHYNRFTASIFAVSAFAVAFAQSQAAAPAAPPAGGVILKYKYTPGEVLRYQSTQTMKSATSVGARSIPMTTHTAMTMTQTVKSVDPRTGNATIVVSTGSPRMTMSMNGQVMPMNMPASAAITSTMVISPAGRPVSMSFGGAAGQQIAATGMGSMFSGGGFGQYSAFPGHPVRVGDIWRSAISLGQTGSEMFIKQSLVGLSSSGGHSIANIASRYTMNMDMTPKLPGAVGGMKITGIATGAGHELFDVNSGTMTGTTTNMVMDMKTKMPPSMAKMTGGMGSVTSRMTMTMSMQRIGG